MKDEKYEQLVKMVIELNKKVAAIEEFLTAFRPHEPVSYDNSLDPLFDVAKELVTQHEYASASLLQRRLSIGYARAARILDQLQEKGIIGIGIGSKPRKVLINKQ